MSVVKGDRKESKVEFDNTFFKVFEDCVRLTENGFGAKTDNYAHYIQSTKMEVIRRNYETYYTYKQ